MTDRKHIVVAKTLKEIDAKLAKKRAARDRVVAAARKRLGKDS